jgi:hypothetical protein
MTEPANKRKLVVPDSPKVVQNIAFKPPTSQPIPISQSTDKKKRSPNENGINTLKEIQARAKELKSDGMKHREAIAQAGVEYREKYGTVRARPKKIKKDKKKK